jgi:P4 family phage/plasmid primase-like protien
VTLDPKHVDELVQGSGIAIERARRMFDSLSDPKACAKLTGLPAQLWQDRTPALVIKYWLPLGGADHQEVRVKPAFPIEIVKKNGEISYAKYVTRSGANGRIFYSSLALECDRWLSDTSVDVLLTEGEKKSEAAATAGFVALSLPGVTMWHAKGCKGLHPDLAHVAWGGRRVVICFDRDALTNAHVRKQEDKLAAALIQAGARVFIVRFPEDAPKLDDCLVKYGKDALAKLIAEAPAFTGASLEPIGAPARGEALTDLGNAERLVMRFGAQLRFCGKWHVWNGSRWASDATGEVHRLAQRTIRELYATASEIKDNDLRTALVDHARKSECRARLEAMVALASTQPEVAARSTDFDRDPWALNTPAGVVDLRTGKVRPHNPADLITRITRASVGSVDGCPRWLVFVLECMDGDSALASYVQRAVGYALTGDIREHCMFFLYGGGANGKGTLVNTLVRLLGDYAHPGAPDLLLETRGDSHPTGQADLFGARLVSVQEVGQGRAWADATLKALTGGDPIKARRMREDFWSFEPSHKFFVSGNFKPRVRGADDGIWRRMRLVPFEVSFKDREDKALPETLAAEASGILAWAVQGCLEWQKHGLAEPERVSSQTQAYRRESDGPGEFIRARCRFVAGETIARRRLRAAYEEWCADRGDQPVSAKRLAEALREVARREGAELAETSVRIGTAVVDGWRGIRTATENERLDQSSDVVLCSDSNEVRNPVNPLKRVNPDRVSTNHYTPTEPPDNVDLPEASEPREQFEC